LTCERVSGNSQLTRVAANEGDRLQGRSWFEKSD